MNRRHLHRRQRAPQTPRRISSENTARWAILGAMLIAASFPPKVIAAYLFSLAVGSMDLKDVKDTAVIVDSISQTTAALADLGKWFMLSNTLIIAGGILITHSFIWGRLRARWYFWLMGALTLFVIWQPLPSTLFGLLWAILLLCFGSEFFAPKAILVSTSEE